MYPNYCPRPHLFNQPCGILNRHAQNINQQYVASFVEFFGALVEYIFGSATGSKYLQLWIVYQSNIEHNSVLLHPQIEMQNSSMKHFFLIAALSLLALSGWAQNGKFTISGTIRDADNGEDVIGANVTVKELPGTGTVTNVYGFYSLTLPAGDYTIVYSFIGFAPQEIPTKLDKDITRAIELGSGAIQLKEAVISAVVEDENITSNEMSVAKIDIKEIESIPVLFGEKDVLKTMQLLPGVKSAGEGSSGFFVRGGTADQNLILLDEAPVYNASHLLGFFSVFNSDALKDVKLYKGGAPAEYGGRLSSVMDIKMKDGNSKKLAVSGGIGLISSKLTIEAPLVKDKGSFIISGRRTYGDLFLKLSADETTSNTQLYFYDLNAKANYRLGEKDRLFLSGYFGRDKFGFGDDFGFDWGNVTGTLRWNHIFSQKLFSNTSVIYSNYDYKISFGGDEGASIGSTIRDYNFKQDFDYFANDKNKIKFGAQVIHHTFDPGSIDAAEASGINDIDIQDTYGLESAVYISNEQKIGAKIGLNYGLRASNFTQLGPGDIRTYDTDGNVIDRQTYADGEVVSSYNGLAPRFSMKYQLNTVSSLKASVSRAYQYLHLVSNSNSGTPTDVWLPSSNNVKPEVGDQVALGYFRNLKDNGYEFSAESYYKTMSNTIDYRTGAQVTLNEEVEGELLFGEGRAYGLELFLKKRKGNFTGWLSYTLSRSERKFDDLNNASWYAARQDRTHDVSVVAMYSLSERTKVSGTWVYYTGNAVTFPSGKYLIDGQAVNYFTERNGYRMPDYHRLDFGVTVDGKNYKLKLNPETGEKEQMPRRYNSSWSFGLYNAYGRENAYSISFAASEENPNITEATQLALFKWVPSVSYQFNF